MQKCTLAALPTSPLPYPAAVDVRPTRGKLL
jgi:hypothetical protein